MADRAHEWTDGQIDRLHRRLAREYSQAAMEMRTKLNDYLEDYEYANQSWKDAVRSGEATREDYRKWLASQASRKRYAVDMTNRLADDALNVDQRAFEIINDTIPQVYAENANWAAYSIERGIGRDTGGFALYDQDTVRRLMAMDENGQVIHEVIPVGPPNTPLQSLRVDLDAAKDVRWNRQKFTSAITQSILQGESIPNTAKRLARVLNMDRGMATRAARTAMTSAENAGRVDSYKRAERIGIALEQEWMATLDERTRHSHRLMDGEHVKVGQKFSNGLEFPGDPSGPGEEIWNCRCTLVAWLPGIEQEDNQRWSRLPEGMTYDDWKSGKVAEEKRKERSGVVDGKDILGTWQRRESEYEFAIRDAINAQGFDGKPRVVGQKEFEDAVKDANGGNGLVLGRGYTAPNQETLDSYRESLYDGDWYVDCSSGRSTYGRGMYCFANTSGDIDAGEQASQTYAKPKRGNTVGYSEVMTLDKSARIIDIEDLFDERFEATRELDEERRKFINTEVEDNAVAVLLGYDAVYVPERDIMIVLNRTKLIIRSPK